MRPAKRYWLFKSEPNKWSWDMQKARGPKGTFWDGVRNHVAKKNLMTMKLGDQGFFYHSNEGKEIVGVVEVIREAYPDPTAEAGDPWVVVDIKAVRPLLRPVTLAQVRADGRLDNMALIKAVRLSVQPVTKAEWQIISELGGLR